MDSLFTIFDCNVIQLPKIQNLAGNITPITNFVNIPFSIKRVYYLYDIPGGESRGAHGHRNLEQLIVAASGSFDITIDDGRNKKTVLLNRPYLGLHLKPGLWRDISNFSSGAICLVLASEFYDELEYIREYQDFLQFRGL
jgi:WxcM-like, C-terminal